ncbi:MAG: 5-(carboxyamino)imidazole ribonucleotide synthase [Trueperaceae bacterium]|nr:5-(carboxyamino)imidazole ribonucleotide synthase [Trueperaceae bacterium]
MRRGVTQRPILPGSRIGIVGGGQLGRMLAAAASRMGYEPHVLDPGADPPAARFAAKHVRAELGDAGAMAEFAAGVDVVTFEFENIGIGALQTAAAVQLVRPSPEVLFLTQDRSREKAFLRRAGLPLAESELVTDEVELHSALERLDGPCVVKTAGFGYDGKGQVKLGSGRTESEMAAARQLARQGPVVVERFVDLAAELSVIVARDAAGSCAAYRPFINRHVNHILDVTLAPFTPSSRDISQLGVDVDTADQAVELACEVARALDAVGLITVEFFLATNGELLVNEIAPRPHNSGHLTIEAAETSQFEQQLRAVCGLPLGSTALTTPAAMANLLGDIWVGGDVHHGVDYAAGLRFPGVSLHLYGKREARPGRKMGHLTATAETVEAAERSVVMSRRALSAP